MGFEFVQEGPSLSVKVTAEWTADAREAATDPSVRKLIIAAGEGPPIDLEDLEGLPVSEIVISDRRINNIEPLARLGSPLLSLVLMVAPDTIVDLSWFPHLQALNSDWALLSNWESRSTNLVAVDLAGYDEASLNALGSNPALEHLRLDGSGLRVLSDLRQLPTLRSLWLQGARRLEVLSGLGDSSVLISDLNLNNCSTLTSLHGIENLSALQKIAFGDCGKIESLKPVADLECLRSVWAYGSTQIVDHDLSPLLGLTSLERFGRRNRRRYKPSVSDVKRHFNIAA